MISTNTLVSFCIFSYNDKQQLSATLPCDATGGDLGCGGLSVAVRHVALSD